jgi:hypothetical protein
MVVGFATTCIISAYHHWNCEFESRWWRGVLDTTLCGKVCQRFTTDLWFSPGTPVSSTNKTDCHDITEILLKVALNTITLKLKFHKVKWYLPCSDNELKWSQISCINFWLWHSLVQLCIYMYIFENYIPHSLLITCNRSLINNTT